MKKLIGVIAGVVLVSGVAYAIFPGGQHFRSAIPQPTREQMDARIVQSDIARAAQKCGWNGERTKVASLVPHWDGQKVMCLARCEAENIHKEGPRHEWECGR